MKECDIEMKSQINKNDLLTFIEQIKRYDLTTVFNSDGQFKDWLSKLNEKQIKNFNKLDIYLNTVKFPRYLLINDNLLNCDDYTNRVEAMLTLKADESINRLFHRLCSANFLNSKNYYQDIEIMSKAKSLEFVMRIINDDNFINSKYHLEDLKLIVEAKDKCENVTDFMVVSRLCEVASNHDSINSPYHQQDMELIANCSSDILSKNNVVELATDKNSLNDKYHLENMKILIENVSSNSDYLYYLMTEERIINGENYRTEIDALLNAESKIKEAAIYLYIANPKKCIFYEIQELLSQETDLSYFNISSLKLTSTFFAQRRMNGNLNPNYLENLKLLNDIDDKFVMYIESLLSNEKSFKNNHQHHDLELLLATKDIDLFMSLYKVMTDEDSLSSPHHKKDIELISQTKNEKVRNLLVSKATYEISLRHRNHRFDMEYITKLNLDDIALEILNTMEYYLFNIEGIECNDHVEMLKKLYGGEDVKKYDSVLEYLNKLEETLKSNLEQEVKIDCNEKSSGRVLTKLKKKIFK